MKGIRIAPLLLLTLGLGSAIAAPGDLIGNVNLPVPGTGVSVGVDCDGNVYYTIEGSTNLYKMDKNGTLLATIPVGNNFDEMAWDNNRQLLWVCLHNSNPVQVWTIDPAVPTVAFAFNSVTNSVGSFRDGIAYDGSDDTIWISGDVSQTIEHYTTAGGFINQITPTNAAGGVLGNISGVTVGVGDLLYLGQNGLAEIVRVRKSDGGFIGSFASPGGARDEGLECDAINFNVLALWSREFNAPGFMSVIELEPGTCACGGEPTPVQPATWGGVKNIYR